MAPQQKTCGGRKGKSALKYICFVLALLLALGGTGCQKREPNNQGTVQQSPPPQEAEELEEKIPEEVSEEPAFTALLNGEALDSAALWDNVRFGPGDKLEITINQGQANSLHLFSLGEKEISLKIEVFGGETTVITEIAPGERWCALPKAAEQITLIFQEEAALSHMQPVLMEEPLEQLAIVGYWPVASAEWEAVESHLNNVTDLVVNTGCYWQADGALAVNQPLKDALAHLNKLPGGSRPAVWCTINPQGALIREGTAGETINTPEKRQALAETMVRFCVENGIQGVDIDWETPTLAEWPDFSSFIVTLSQKLQEEGLRLSLALYPGNVHLGQEAIAAVDRVNIMAYDQFDSQGRHATYEAAKAALDYFASAGFSQGQLCLGVPAYGRPLDMSAQWPFYSSAQLSQGANLQGDVYYNGPQLAADKTMLAASQGLQGLMVYHLSCDLPGDNPQALTAVILRTSQGEQEEK